MLRINRHHARKSLAEQENNTPMMAIFGGFFGFLLVFLVIVNLLTSEAIRERLELQSDDTTYKIPRPDETGAGYIVISFTDSIHIIETDTNIKMGSICDAQSDFIAYAEKIYANPGDQLVFFILEGSVPVLAEARECLRNIWPGKQVTIGWVMADKELLKSVSLDDVPSYIQEYVDSQK